MMKKGIFTFGFFISLSQISMAAAPNGSTILLYGIIGLCVLLTLVALVLVATNMMNLEAHKHGIDIEKENFSAIPGADDFLSKQ